MDTAVSENNPYGTNSADASDPYKGYQDPAAQYSAQNQYGGTTPYGGSTPQTPLQSQPQGTYTQGNPTGGQNPFASAPQASANAAYYQQAPNPYAQAEKDAQTSWIVALVGLLLNFGLITGPIAIYLANKAERGGASATVGKVLGWISVGLSLLGVVVIGFFLIAAVSASTY
jgi:hypothetical protein